MFELTVTSSRQETRMLRLPAAFTALLVLLSLLSACSKTPAAVAKQHMERGEASLAKADARRAVLEFKIASQNTPADPEPQYRLGIAFLQVKDGRAAVKAFEKVLQLNPNHPGALFSYARMKAEANQPEILHDAEDMLQKVLAGRPGDAPALYALAMVETKLKKPDDAVRYFQDALDHKAAPMEDIQLPIAAAAFRGDLVLGRQFVTLARTKLPGSAKLAVLSAEVALAAGDEGNANAETARALSLDSQLPEALRLQIRLAERAGRGGDSESAARKLAALPDPANHSAFADVLFAHGKTEEALAEYKAAAERNPADHLAGRRYIDGLFRAHKTEQAKAILDAAIRNDPKREDLLEVRARLALYENRIEEAGVDLALLDKLKADTEGVVLLKAIYHGARGENEQAGDLLNRVLGMNPRLLEARLRLARLLTESGKADVAVRILDAASKAEASVPALIHQRNAALIASGAWEDAASAVRAQMKSQKIPSADLLMQDATIRLHYNDLSGAEKEVVSILSSDPGNAAALEVMSSIYTSRKKSKDYIVWLAKHADANPTVATLQIEAARMLRVSGDLAGARRDLARVSSGPQADQAAVETAVVDMAEGKRDEARTILQSSIRKRDSALARVLLADLYSSSGDLRQSEEQLRAALALSPSDPVILINLAAAISKDPKRRDAALPFAEKALALSGGNADVESSSGWFYYKAGRYQQAVAYLEAALKTRDSATTRYRLAAACMKSGDQACADTQYAAALRTNPTDPVRSEVDPLLHGVAR